MNDVCILIPAHNESRIISSTLASVARLLPPEHTYLVDDGSSDSTTEIASTQIPHVLKIPNSGKAVALNTALIRFALPQKYDFILFIDADTNPDPDFLTYALPHFAADPFKKIVCVVGRVKGLGTNWISRYRQWEYHVSHFIHKRAQANLKSIVVVPGCATIYRSYIFNELQFPVGTLTEDMDFTFLLHRQGLSNIVFEDRSVVRVQDPQRLPDFIKQITRWYTGFWQVVRKHQIPWHGQTLDLEVVMLGIEGLYNGMIVLLLLFSLIPLALSQNLGILAYPALIDFLAFFLPSLIWTSVAEKNFRYLLYIPHFYFLRSLSSLIFIRSFFLGLLSPAKEYTWDSRRY
jgi:cellulose synthase/poly-beta-1,6-N-acetylglucosamine synthase-like glycosyltransferase